MKPCPFCNSADVGFSYGKHPDGRELSFISCSSCGAAGPVRTYASEWDDDESAASWNKRHPTTTKIVSTAPEQSITENNALWPTLLKLRRMRQKFARCAIHTGSDPEIVEGACEEFDATVIAIAHLIKAANKIDAAIAAWRRVRHPNIADLSAAHGELIAALDGLSDEPANNHRTTPAEALCLELPPGWTFEPTHTRCPKCGHELRIDTEDNKNASSNTGAQL